jgi:ATP-dependent Clp protease adaptor protein ClpS
MGIRDLLGALFNGDPGTRHDVSAEDDTIVGNLCRVILFNDEIHTFDDVINQLRKATGCTAGAAEAMAFEVHTRGKAMVFEGEMLPCLRVTSILEEIALHTQIEC